MDRRTDVLDRAGTPALGVRDYRQLVVDARLYGSQDISAGVFTEGTVLFVSAS
jgi:hypothetical protein